MPTVPGLPAATEIDLDDVIPIDQDGTLSKIAFDSMLGDNLLINQDFSIWQENTTFTNPANSTYTADGFYVEKGGGTGGTAPSVNVKKNTSVTETAFSQSCELEITAVGTAATDRYWRIRQKVENFAKYAGRTVTVSARVRASTTINFTNNGGSIALFDGVSGGDTNFSQLTTSWQTIQYTHTVNANPTDLRLAFSLVVDGSNGGISTVGSVYIQWIKLEIGSVATPLKPRSDHIELLLCQRYYQKSYPQVTAPGTAGNQNIFQLYTTGHQNVDYNMAPFVNFFAVMRTTPTVTVYDSLGNLGKVKMAAGDNITPTLYDIGDAGFQVSATNGAASTVRQLTFHWVADARL